MLRPVAALLLLLCVGAAAAPAERVVVLATRDSSTRALVIAIERSGAKMSASAPQPFGIAPAVHHATRPTVHGALAGDDLVLVADDAAGRYAASLWRVSRTDAVRVLDSVAAGSRPVVAGRRVYVTVGHPADTESTPREDDLVVTELDLDGGTTRPVAHLIGYEAQTIGADEEHGLLVYGVTPHSHGNVLAIDLHDGTPRDLGAIGPASALSFVTRLRIPGRLLGPTVLYDGVDGDGRVVAAFSLDGERNVLARATPQAPLPIVLGEQLVPIERTPRGLLLARGVARDGARLYERRSIPNATQSLVVRAADGAEVVVAVPADESWELVGFLR